MFYSLTKNLFSRKIFALLFLSFCLTILNAERAKAETLDLHLEVASTSRLVVTGKFSSAQNSVKSLQTRWLFPDQYADAVNLSRRFSKPEFADASGAAVASQTKASNEFVAAHPIFSWKYEINLEMPADAMTAAHVSWLRESGGLLMPADLLPQIDDTETISARVRISLPAGWKIATVEKKIGENEFSVADVEKAVFLVGKDFEERTGWIGKTEFRIASAGKWTFSTDDIVTMASQILEEHRRIFADLSINRFQLILLPLPSKLTPDRWRAETRGASIVLLSGVIPFKSIALNRLHEQLRHEIFHFWIPNGLNLSGSYDWFYEGFTLYQALKTGVRLEYIRFEDFLDTLSRAMDAARRAQNTNQISLLDASRERWRGGAGANLIYAKGMVVAFLCDAALLNQTGGKDSLSVVFRELYRKHNLAAARADGNAAVLETLKKYPQLAEIIHKYVEQAGAIEPKALENLSGLVNLSNSNFTKLAINSSLSGRQKKVLEKLGYKRS